MVQELVPSPKVPAQPLPEPVDVAKAQEVIFKPNPGPQTDFLASSEQDVLYGGAGGGGKSFAMIADPVRNFNNPYFKGLLLRRTTEELRELISVSKQLYPQAIPGIKFLEREKTWITPSGASLWMSYLDADDDVMRYQGQAFCVAEGTPIAMANGGFKSVELVREGEEVVTLGGNQKVTWLSSPQLKYCVKVTVYSSDGRVVSQQLQPDNHPIALLSSKPWTSLSDLSQTLVQFQKSQIQWLSYTQLVSGLEGNPGTSSSEEGVKNGCEGSEQSNQETLQPQKLFFPVVLHEPSLRLAQDHASTQCRSSDKFSKRLYDSYRETLEKPKGLPQHDEHAQSSLDYKHEHYHPSYDGAADAHFDLQKVEGFLENYSSCYDLCDGQLREALGYDQCYAHTQVDAEAQDLYDHRNDETGCTPLRTPYRVTKYNHPYTQGLRDLKVQLELGIVCVEPLENPWVVVRDITVDTENNYISFGGVVNQNCWIGFDELTQWSSPHAWNYMRSRLRTTTASGLKLYQRATTNPGGPGHSWVKKTFIDPAPPNTAFWATDPDSGEVIKWPKGHSREGEPLFKRRFIPATLFDNPYLASDGMYEANLLSLPEHQRRQLLYGDWDINEGAAFPEFNRRIHVVEPFDIPHGWTKFRAADYGYGSNTGVVWIAVSPSEQLIVYREMYNSKVTAWDLADLILEAEEDDNVRYGVLDSSLWHNRGDRGPSLAEQMISKGCRWRPSDRSRGSRVAGKNELHRRLQVDPFTGEPRLVIFNTCKNLIAQLPSIPLDKNNPEDVDTNAEDHLYDALRYGIMSRPKSSLWDYNPATHGSSYKVIDEKFGY